jgi:uncharacterized protein (TIGR02145 family)
MRRALFILFALNALLIPEMGLTQGEWNNWYFGWHAAMTFNSGDPVGITGSALTASGGSCTTTVSDSAGNLLFYANGWKIWNRNNVVMPNGSGFLGGNLCSQPVFSAPVPGFAQQYYVFMVGDPDNSGAPLIGLHYSVVDMSLQSGLGDVIPSQKFIYVPGGDSAVDQLTGTRAQNNRDYWIVVRKHKPVTHYLAYLVDASGLNTIPVVSPTTLKTRYWWQFGHLATQRGGDMKISFDGKFLVCHDSLTEICRFNDTTGVVTPLFKVYIDVNICGAEFSIDSKYLYVSTRGSGIPNQCHLYQFDMSYLDSLSFMQHMVVIGDGAAFKLQMGPNWKIYATLYNGLIDSLNCINSPSLAGPACNYQKNVVCLLGNGNNGVLVQFLQRYKAYIHSTGNCQWDPVQFTGDIWPPPDSLHWDFGDPASGALNYSPLANPSHVYTSAGTFTVELIVRHIDKRIDTAWKMITVFPAPTVNLGPDQTVCLGNSVTFDAGACSGCTYQWIDLATGLTVATTQTFTTAQAGTYTVAVTSPNACVTRDTVQLLTTAVPVLANSPLNKTICTGESTNISLSSVPPGAMFHWTATLTLGIVTGFSADSGLVINQVLTNSLATPGIVTYHITPKIGSCSGSAVDFPVTVNPGDSVKVSISASGNTICSGTSITYTATPTYGGSSPSYQWKVNGVNAGTNSSVFTYTPLNNDVVSCILTSSNTICVFNNPATSNAITMIVNPQMPVSVSITSSLNPVCAGNTVLFTAHPINEGSSPVYQWKVNGVNAGSNSSTFTYIPLNNDQVSCVMTSSLTTCVTNNPATSNTIIMQVDQNHPVSLTVSASLNPVCAGNSVLFTSLPVNPGLTPVYQWKVNGVITGTNSSTFTYTPVNNDQISCVLTSSLTICVTNNPATSNVVTMTVNPNYTVSVSITTPSDTVCQGTAVLFTAHPVNEGLTPVYQWKVNGVNTGANSSTFSYTPVNNDVVSCVLTSSYNVCTTNNPATSNAVTIAVINTLTAGVSITAVPNPFCSGSTVNCSAIPTNGGFTPSYQWKVNGVNAGTNASTYSFVPVQGDIVQCAMNSSLSCITNNPVTSNTIVMNALASPSVSFTLCFDSITTINAAAFKLKGGVPIGGVYSGPGVNSSTGIFTPSIADIGTKTIVYFYQNSFSCANSKSKTIIVQAAPSFNCGQNLTDIRDNKVYSTVQLGTQCWMQKNLNYGTSLQGTTEQTDNCINEKYCYNDNASNCTLYGGLYQWDELMAYNSTPVAQGLCPPGWHVPTQSEWNTLFTFYQQQALAGKPLQDTIIMGFRAKESGVIYSNFSWSFKGFATIFWTSTPSGTIKAMSHGMNLINFSVSDYLANRSNAFAVRCLHD